jgi:hypothetical protein
MHSVDPETYEVCADGELMDIPPAVTLPLTTAYSLVRLSPSSLFSSVADLTHPFTSSSDRLVFGLSLRSFCFARATIFRLRPRY